MKDNRCFLLLAAYFILVTYLYAQSSLDELYNSALKQFQDGNYKSAIELFDLVISTATKGGNKRDKGGEGGDKNILRKAYLTKADALSELLELDSALKEYRRIIEKFPNTNESLKAKLGIGLVYYKKNNYETARAHFLNYIKKYPDTRITDDAQYWLGMLHFKNKNFRKAAVSFTALVQNYPKSNYAAEGWLRLGDCYYNLPLKKYKQARNSYRKVLTKYPDSPQAEFALYNIGRTYDSEGSVYDAISIYVQFVEKYPKSKLSPEITYRVASYFYKKKKYEKAANYFEQIVINFPESELLEDASFMYSKTLYKQGAKTDAANSFQKFIATYPLNKNNIEAILYIGNYYLDSGDYQNAISNYEKGLMAEISDTEIIAMLRYNCALAYQKISDTITAEKYFAEILYRYPKSLAAAKMYLQRGVDLERAGDYFAAIENYELAATISKNKNIQKNGSVDYGIEDDVGALAQKKAADCFFIQKKYKEAAREYLKVVYLFNDSELVAESHFMSARASEEIGYVKEAKQNYEIVKKKYANTEWAKKSTERLQEINKK
ncbi:MAG: tetratricopeptide repeat protein [Elusimicrobiota bacterium]